MATEILNGLWLGNILDTKKDYKWKIPLLYPHYLKIITCKLLKI